MRLSFWRPSSNEDCCSSGSFRVSSLHLRFLAPLEPGLKEIFERFRRVMTVEINYSDPPDAPLINPHNRRRPQLARLDLPP